MTEEDYLLAMEYNHTINAYTTLIEDSSLLIDEETLILITTLVKRLNTDSLLNLLNKQIPEEVMDTWISDITSSRQT